MQYEATIDSESMSIYDRETKELLDAVAVIPSHEPDLVALVDLVPRELAGKLARMAARRAKGF